MGLLNGVVIDTVERVVLVVALAAAAGCAPAVSPLNIEGARTEARVKTALVNDPVIGTRVINVRMLGTVAQLSGSVRSQAEADRAAELARSVSGVTQVDVRLQIGSDPSESAVADERRTDPTRGPAYELAEVDDPRDVFGLGGSINWATQSGRSFGSRVSINPLVKIGSGAGFGPAIALEWFDATLAMTPDARPDAGAVKIRPIMAGVRYTIPVGRVAFSPSLVAGYAFNAIRVPDEGGAPGLPVGIDNSWVLRPGVTVWIDSGRRTSVNMSLGRAITSPQVTFVENGRLLKRSVSANTTVALVGLVYRLF